jgi:hypothetical protein
VGHRSFGCYLLMRGIASVTKCIKPWVYTLYVHIYAKRARRWRRSENQLQNSSLCRAEEKWEVWEILIYCTPTGENSFTSPGRKRQKRGRKKALLEYSAAAAFPFPVKHHLSLSTIIHYHHQLQWPAADAASQQLLCFCYNAAAIVYFAHSTRPQMDRVSLKSIPKLIVLFFAFFTVKNGKRP